MSNTQAPYQGAMEAKGAYNRHAKLSADGAALALPLLEKAVQSVEIEPDGQSIVIADYGSSQGKNSMAPMQLAIRGLRRASVQIAQSLYSTLTRRRTILPHSLEFSLVIRTDMSW